MRHIPACLIPIAVLALGRPARAADDLIANWPEPPAGFTEGPAAAPAAPPAPPAPPVAPATPPAVAPVAAPEPTVVAPAAVVPPVAPPPRFGDAGSLALDGNLSAGFGHLSYGSSNSTSDTFGVQPSFDYFSSDGFSEGASVFFKYGSSTSGIDITNRTISYGATIHAGRNLWMGERVSFWPRLEFGVWQSRTKYSGIFSGVVSVDGMSHQIGEGIDLTEQALYVELFAPFLFHVAQHFFVGFGPDVVVDVFHSAGGTTNRRQWLSAESTVGGWF